MYDASLGRFHTIDPMAEEPHNLSLTPYHYTNNNPILFIDINGEDWFVNGETGGVLYVKGVSEFNEDQIEMYGEGWSNFGADDMFGDEIMMEGRDGEMENILDRNDYEFGSASGEKFMNEQGYAKGERAQFEKTDFETTVYDDGTLGGRSVVTSYKVEVGEREFTYAKPENFNKKEPLDFKAHQDDNMSYQKENYSMVVKPGTKTRNRYISPAQVIKQLLGIGSNIVSDKVDSPYSNKF